MPRVSVIMAVYNTAKFLPEAIESILTQTYADFEFVIIDDGSTDSSLEIVRHYAEGDDRIRYSTRENRGISVTRSEGLASARGDLYAVMDSDDVSVPTRLERQVDYLDKNPECVCVGTYALHIDPAGCPIGTEKRYLSHEDIDNAHMRGEAGAIAHSTSLMRLHSVRDVGGYRPKFEVAEDFDLFLRLAEVGRLANIAEVLYQYRQLENSMSHRSSRHGRDRMCALQDAYRRRGITGDLPHFSFQEADVHPNLTRTYRGWSWLAIQSGHRRTARKYAVKSLIRAPLALASYGLLWRALCMPACRHAESLGTGEHP